jgi:HSP20 family protein
MAEKQEKAKKGPEPQKPEKRLAATQVPVKRQVRTALPVRAPQPLWPLSAWEEEMDRWFEHFRRRFPSPLWRGEPWPLEPVKFAPALDVYEKGNEVVVKAELPGLSKDDIEVNLTESTLTVKGEKKQEEEIKHQDYYHYERSVGAFSRRIELPTTVKADEATASFKDGVLEVRLPKSEEAKRRVVKVQVG